MNESSKLILPANLVLLLLGIIDLVSTLWWLKTGQAIESNPLMAAALKGGIPLFVTIKMFTLAAYVGVIEWYRRRRSALLARAIGLYTSVAYVSVYTVSFISVNHDYLLG